MLLKIGYERTTLKKYFFLLLKAEALADVIDIINLYDRTALAWAVEYGWVNAVATLLYFSVNLYKKLFFRNKLFLLYFVIAESTSNTGFFNIIRILLRAGVNINIKDYKK